jgi:hypothetical protein
MRCSARAHKIALAQRRNSLVRSTTNQHRYVKSKISFRFSENYGSLSDIPVGIEGRFAIVTNVGLEKRWTR